jgi:hypothetical protein
MTWLKKCFTWHWTTHDIAEKMFYLALDNSWHSWTNVLLDIGQLMTWLKNVLLGIGQLMT